MLKVGLVGVGGISSSHIDAWLKNEDVELCALCDIRPEQMEKYPDQRHYTDVREMLDKERLDILDICLPTNLHVDTALLAIEKGVNVISEKPISLKKEEVARVYNAAREHHVCFMVAQVVRFWPAFELVKEAYDSGKYGKLLSGSMQRLGNCPRWSWDDWMRDEHRSGLVPYDLHVHDLDFMIYAFGKPKDAKMYRARRPEQDVVSAVYTFDGFYINSEATWYGGGYPFSSSFRFQFEKALIAFENNKVMVYPLDGEAFEVQEHIAADDMGNIQLPRTSAFAKELSYFADCVKAGVPADKIKPEELETVIDILNRF